MKTRESLVHVAVALIVHRGLVLVGRRPAGSRYGGAWEFPGGKIEHGETPRDALVRELREELNIEATTIKLIHRSTNSFEDGGTFDVQYAIVTSFSGSPTALVHDELKWIPFMELKNTEMISGNAEIVDLLCAGTWINILGRND